MSLGLHFALLDDDLERLLSIDDEDELVDFIVEDLEERYLTDDRWSYQSDKAWDAIHRCLGDGTLLYETGPHPLTYAVLGGRSLDAGEDYTACLVEAPNVRETSRALARVTREWLRRRYDTLGDSDYGQPLSDEDFDYTEADAVGPRGVGPQR